MHLNINYSEYNIESGSGSGKNNYEYDYEYDYNYDYGQETYTITNHRKVLVYIFIAFVICFWILIIPYLYDSCCYFKYKFNINFKKIKNITNAKCINCKLKYINYKNKNYKNKNKNKIIPNDDGDMNDDDCTICLSNNDKNSIILLCHHRFHSNCINQWIQTSIDNRNSIQCPLCRVTI